MKEKKMDENEISDKDLEQVTGGSARVADPSELKVVAELEEAVAAKRSV